MLTGHPSMSAPEQRLSWPHEGFGAAGPARDGATGHGLGPPFHPDELSEPSVHPSETFGEAGQLGPECSEARTFLHARHSAWVLGEGRGDTDYLPSPNRHYVLQLSSLRRPRGWRALQPTRGPRRCASYRLLEFGRATDDSPLLRLAARAGAAAWSPDSRQLALSAEHPRRPSSLGRLAWWRAGDERLTLVDAATGRCTFVGPSGSGGARLEWSPRGGLLSVLSPVARDDGLWHRASIWGIDAAQAGYTPITSGLWQAPVATSFSPNERFVTLHIGADPFSAQRLVFDIEALRSQAAPQAGPPAAEPLPAAQAVEWFGEASVMFARDSSFTRLGTAGSWTPSALAVQPNPVTLTTNWAYVVAMRMSPAGHKAAVLAQDSTFGLPGDRSQVYACITFLHCSGPAVVPPIDLGIQVRLRGAHQQGDGLNDLISWGPPGATRDFLAVALPNTRSLWLVDSIGGSATELERNLGAHRRAEWSVCGRYLLVTDGVVAVPHRLGARLAPQAMAQLRIYAIDPPQQIFQDNQWLAGPAPPAPTLAFADPALHQVVWLLPDKTEIIDFAVEA